MKLILTSFGINENSENEGEQSLFYRMPPVSMRGYSSNRFLPDYAALLLCENLIMDEASFLMLIEKHHPAYRDTSETISALYGEGLIELVDFNQIINNNRELLHKMLDHDLQILDSWVEPLKDSMNIWNGFTHNLDDLDIGYGRNYHPHMHAPVRSVSMPEDIYEYIDESKLPELYDSLEYDDQKLLRERLIRGAFKSSQKRKKAIYRDALKDVLKSYLEYVNANIVISNELGVGFYDWADMSPLYTNKFLSVGKESLETEKHVDELRKLFEVPFPEFAVTNTSILMRLLKDKRISDLRQLVNEAVEGKVTFDNEFAKNVLKEVLGIERKVAKYRNIASYLTIPLDFIPWVGTFAQMAVEETAGVVIERKLKNKFQWFYMLSEVAEPKPKTA